MSARVGTAGRGQTQQPGLAVDRAVGFLASCAWGPPPTVPRVCWCCLLSRLTPYGAICHLQTGSALPLGQYTRFGCCGRKLQAWEVSSWMRWFCPAVWPVVPGSRAEGQHWEALSLGSTGRRFSEGSVWDPPSTQGHSQEVQGMRKWAGEGRGDPAREPHRLGLFESWVTD